MSKTIDLTRGYVTIVDDDDYDWLSQWDWYAGINGIGTTVNAVRASRSENSNRPLRVYMHRQILGLQAGDKGEGDHRSGDTLDNRRANLRIVSRIQNSVNRKLLSNNKCGHRGIYWDWGRRKWRARITVNKKVIRLGRYADIEDAIAARIEAEELYFGEYSCWASRGVR